MDKHDLLTIGLSPQQADVYMHLVNTGGQKPSVTATELGLTRTNVYKILDSLVELGIVEKNESGRTLAYLPASPLTLTSLSARYRAEAVRREETVNRIMHDLLAAYSKHIDKPGVATYSGQVEVAEAYRKQINLKENLFFIHTSTDVPMMGFEIMHEIRMAPSSHGKKRRGIMQAPRHRNINYAAHKRSALGITWIDIGRYTEPVEWSVTDSSLLIASYKAEPQAILIIDKIVAAAFKQLFLILESHLSKEAIHHKLDALKS